MGSLMKITMEIVDSLLAQARRLAKRDGVTLRALVEKGLRSIVARRSGRKRFKLRKASVRGRGRQPGIGEGRWDVMRDLAYEGRGA